MKLLGNLGIIAAIMSIKSQANVQIQHTELKVSATSKRAKVKAARKQRKAQK